MDGYVTPQMFGAVGDDSAEDADSIQAAEDSGYPVWFPPATYKISSSITRSASSIWLGAKTETTLLKFYGTDDNMIELGGLDYMKTANLTLLSASGNQSGTSEIAVRHGPDLGAVFIHYENCIIDGFSVAGVYVTRGWNLKFDNVYFIRNGHRTTAGAFTGGLVFDRTGSGQADWSASGTTLNACTFISSEWGIYNDAGWNVSCDNCIFEDLGKPFHKSANGSLMEFNKCWFEDADAAADIQGAVIVRGGRDAKKLGYAAGVAYQGISGSFGRVVYEDADVIEHYSDNTGTPISYVDFANKVAKIDNIVSSGSATLTASTGEQVGVDNTGGDFRPFGTNGTQDLGGPSNRWSVLFMANGVNPGSFTDTALNDITNAINTTDKSAGKAVFNTTQAIWVYSGGATAGSVWKRFSDDTTANTPV